MNKHQQKFNKKGEDFKREELRKVLNRCTNQQQKIFNLMYESIETIPEKKMSWAYNQVMNSLNLEDK